MAPKAEHFITFTADGIGSVRVLKGDGAPKVTDGYGGWEVRARPHRVGLTQWTGSNPITMAIPIVFEGWTDNSGQEIRISRLSRMALPQSSTQEPPIVEIDGLGIPKPGPKRWVIANIEWGDLVLWDTEKDSGSMVRLRQDAVVTIMQYVAEDRTAFAKVEVGSGAWPKHYTWKKGDTLQRVAAKFYHNSKKWHQIAKANNIRDPKNIKVGRVLVIPKPE